MKMLHIPPWHCSRVATDKSLDYCIIKIWAAICVCVASCNMTRFLFIGQEKEETKQLYRNKKKRKPWLLMAVSTFTETQAQSCL